MDPATPVKTGNLRRWLLIAGIVVCACCVGLAVVGYLIAPRIRHIARDRAEAYLRARFNSSVQFEDFYVVLYPRIHLTIKGLILRHEGRTDVPPLIEVREVTVDAAPGVLWGKRRVIDRVHLAGLKIHTPPKAANGTPMIHGTDADLAKKYPFVIKEIDADDATLVMLRRPEDSAKPPNEFSIHQLVLNDFSFDRPASFHALLTNPKPKGEIHCDGQFGPWSGEDPAGSPVNGRFNFSNADLGTLQGLSGTLSSRGKFNGVLDYLNVQGSTDTPDFALRTSAHPMALHTDYAAVVDGTNGNTVLTNVTAHFLNTTLETRGEVVDVYRDRKGRTIALDASSDEARVEDLLALAVKSDHPVMTGSARLEARILIPERNEDLIDRLQLDGKFGFEDVHFTSASVQGKVDTLSRKGQGAPKNLEISDMMSGLEGQFKLGSGAVTFSDLAFAVEGASISLGGTYNLDSGQMDFRGKLRMDAKISQTMTGWKSVVLKPFDHFFKGQDGGSEIPIKITGSREHPDFGSDFHDKDNKK